MNVALIQFKDVGKKYYFNPKDFDLHTGDSVVVETIKGLEVGSVYQLKEVDEKTLEHALKDILRVANDEDMKSYIKNITEVPLVVNETKRLAQKHQLDMKVTTAEYTLDRKKLMIYFEAEGRIDFRELVKDLSEKYHTRIELRQIGPRDTAKMVGGIGPCGLILCCSTFIGEFDTVSIKMAKNQNLSLNPQKISGVCGKLLCCIKYEDDVYTELKQTMPDLYEFVETEQGKAKVIGVNILGQKVQLKYAEGNTEWLEVSELKPA